MDGIFRWMNLLSLLVDIEWTPLTFHSYKICVNILNCSSLIQLFSISNLCKQTIYRTFPLCIVSFSTTVKFPFLSESWSDIIVRQLGNILSMLMWVKCYRYNVRGKDKCLTLHGGRKQIEEAECSHSNWTFKALGKNVSCVSAVWNRKCIIANIKKNDKGIAKVNLGNVIMN